MLRTESWEMSTEIEQGVLYARRAQVVGNRESQMAGALCKGLFFLPGSGGLYVAGCVL